MRNNHFYIIMTCLTIITAIIAILAVVVVRNSRPLILTPVLEPYAHEMDIYDIYIPVILKDAYGDVLSDINGAYELKQTLRYMTVRMEAKNSEMAEMLEMVKIRNLQSQIVNQRMFYSFMDFRAITSRTSRQWDLQQRAVTDSSGIRRYNGRVMTAVGTGWGFSVGDNIYVHFCNGDILPAVVGDVKSDMHTCINNKITRHNGCVMEHIICSYTLPQNIRTSGNMATMGVINGYVVNITG